MEKQAPPALDEIDRKMIALLQQDARMPTGALARELGISRPTVNKRLDRLLQEGLLHLLAETDIQASGKEFLVILGIRTELRPAEEVADDLAQLDEALAVQTVSGRHDIEVVIAAEHREHLNHLLTEVIPAIPGISERTPGLCLDVLKFASNRVPAAL